MKESGLRIRVDNELRAAFINACKSEDLTAAQVIRNYMRKFVDNHTDNSQPDLFVDNSDSVKREPK